MYSRSSRAGSSQTAVTVCLMSELLVVIGWYATGFVVAHGLVGRGHSPVIWWVGAAVLGALVFAPAVCALIWRSRTSGGLDLVHRGSSTKDWVRGLHVVAVAPVDHLGSVIDEIPTPIGQQAHRVTVVGTVGHEAFCSGIETGERRRAAQSIGALVRPCSTTDDRIVTTEGVQSLAAVFSQVGVPDLVVTRARPGRTPCRRALEMSLELSAAHGLPVLIAPVRRSLIPTPKRELSRIV